MSSPYGPPAGAGQQGPGSYPGPSAATWGPGPGGPTYGNAAPGGGPYGPPPGSGSGGFAGPGPGGFAGPGSGGFAGSGGPGYGPGSGYGPAAGGPTPAGSGGQGGPGQGPAGQGGAGPAGSGGVGGPNWPGPAPKPKIPMDLSRTLPLTILALGVVGFICGFLRFASYSGPGAVTITVTVFGAGPSYLPVLVLLVGFLAYAPALPGGRDYHLPAALLSASGLLGAIGAISTASVLDKLAESSGTQASSSTGIGMYLLLTVAILQAITAVYAWVTHSDSADSGSGKPGQRRSGARKFGPAAPPAGTPLTSNGQGGQPFVSGAGAPGPGDGGQTGPGPAVGSPGPPAGYGSAAGFAAAGSVAPGGYGGPAEYGGYGPVGFVPGNPGQDSDSPADGTYGRGAYNPYVSRVESNFAPRAGTAAPLPRSAPPTAPRVRLRRLNRRPSRRPASTAGPKSRPRRPASTAGTKGRPRTSPSRFASDRTCTDRTREPPSPPLTDRGSCQGPR